MSLRLLSAKETYWDKTALAAEQTTGFGHRKRTLRFSINPKSQITIEAYDDGMRSIGVMVFNDLDIDGMLQYLQDVKQYISEQELIDKLLNSKLCLR
jgi:hypothetical protein